MDQDAAALKAQRQMADEASRAAWGSAAAAAAAAGAGAFVAGTVAESAIVRAVRGNPAELAWLSDAVVSAGVAAITYLWLHLRASRTRLAALEREQIALDEQLRVAARIQRELLPEVPKAAAGFRWAAGMIPAGRVGGDFYDWLQRDGSVLALLADVSGKGVPAALILSSLKTLFRTVARETLEPAVIAERLSDELYEGHGGMPYATAILARFGPGPRVVYVNAGHPAGYLLRAGAPVACFGSGGRPLGLFPATTYEARTVDLTRGDVGVLVTDGITEALETGPLTLVQALTPDAAALSAQASPEDLRNRVLQAAASGPGPAGVEDWQDDRTVLVFAVEDA